MRAALFAIASMLVVVGCANASRPLPSIKISAVSPMQVRGSHFVGKEKVSVTVAAGKGRFTRTALASATGAFTLSFGILPEKDRCSGSISVTARGVHHDGATYQLPSLDCVTAPSGPTATYG